MPLNLDRYNNRIEDAADDALREFKSAGQRHNIIHRPQSDSPAPSLNKFRKRLKQNQGAVEVIGFQFPRNLIWTHKGAGKGRAGTKGSRWVDKYGTQKTTNPKSYGSMGTGGRVAKEFINEVLNGLKGVSNIADIAAEELGDALVGNLFI